MKNFLQYARTVLCASALLATSAYAQVETVAGSIAATATVDSVISGVRTTLQEAISQAEVAGTVVSFRVASDAKVLLQNLDIMAKELSGKVFADLTAAQQSALNNLLVVSKETTRDLKGNINALDGAVRDAGQEIARLPGVSKRPFVSSYSPGYMLAGAASSMDVLVKGSMLNVDKISLTLNKSQCILLSGVENALRFSCPIDAVGSPQRWVTGDLGLQMKTKWYAFWKGPQVFDYKVAVSLVQPEMGSYTLQATVTESSSERIARTQSNGYRNGHCDGDHSVAWTFTPSRAECSIDVTSVQTTPSATSKSGYEGVINLGPAGFQFRGVVRNSGHCFGPSKDARGSLNVTATWTDVCPITREVVQVPQEGKLLWNRETELQLPKGTSSWLIKVSLNNGTQHVLSSAGSFPWFTVSFDPVARLVVIRPRALEDALL